MPPRSRAAQRGSASFLLVALTRRSGRTASCWRAVLHPAMSHLGQKVRSIAAFSAQAHVFDEECHRFPALARTDDAALQAHLSMCFAAEYERCMGADGCTRRQDAQRQPEMPMRTAPRAPHRSSHRDRPIARLVTSVRRRPRGLYEP